MVNETITASLGTRHPEDNPALQGCCPPPPGRHRPLADAHGEPLLPRVVRALKAGLMLPSPAGAGTGRVRTVLDAGEAYPAVDLERLARYVQDGRKLQAVVVGEQLGSALRFLASALGRAVSGLQRRTVHSARAERIDLDVERLRDYGRRGILDVPPDYEQRRSLFYGRGL